MFVVTSIVRGARRYFSWGKANATLPQWGDERDALKFETAAKAVAVCNEFGGKVEIYPPMPQKR